MISRIVFLTSILLLTACDIRPDDKKYGNFYKVYTAVSDSVHNNANTSQVVAIADGTNAEVRIKIYYGGAFKGDKLYMYCWYNSEEKTESVCRSWVYNEDYKNEIEASKKSLWI